LILAGLNLDELTLRRMQQTRLHARRAMAANLVSPMLRLIGDVPELLADVQHDRPLSPQA
jgi:hypothetical protein